MQAYAVAAGLDPHDVVHLDQHHPFVLADRYALQVVLPPLQRGQGLHDPRGRVRIRPGGGGQPLFGAPQRLGEAFAAERFHQVVHRVGVERAHGELLVGGDEDGGRHARRADRRHHVQAGDRRHLDVQEHQVRGQVADRRHRGHAVSAFAGHGDVRILAQQPHHRVACDRFVVHHQRGDLHAGTCSGSSPSSSSWNGRRSRHATPRGTIMSSRRLARSP